MSYSIRGLALGLGIGLASCSAGDEVAKPVHHERRVSSSVQSHDSYDFSADRFKGKKVLVFYESDHSPLESPKPSDPAFLRRVTSGLESVGAFTSSHGVINDAYPISTAIAFGDPKVPTPDYVVIADRDFDAFKSKQEDKVYRAGIGDEGRLEFRRLYRSR